MIMKKHTEPSYIVRGMTVAWHALVPIKILEQADAKRKIQGHTKAHAVKIMLEWYAGEGEK